MPLGILFTGTIFGLLHSSQLGNNWPQVGLLVLVGIIFTYVRAKRAPWSPATSCMSATIRLSLSRLLLPHGASTIYLNSTRAAAEHCSLQAVCSQTCTTVLSKMQSIARAILIVTGVD